MDQWMNVPSSITEPDVLEHASLLEDVPHF